MPTIDETLTAIKNTVEKHRVRAKSLNGGGFRFPASAFKTLFDKDYPSIADADYLAAADCLYDRGLAFIEVERHTVQGQEVATDYLIFEPAFIS